MRTASLTLVLCVGFSLGGGCLPLVDNTVREPVPGQKLAISIAKPDTDRSVARGDQVKIEWSAANLTGQPATISFHVESRRASLTKALLEQFELQGTGDSGVVRWDTGDYSGPYAIIARIEAAGQYREAIAAGKITVDAPPTFKFTAPSGDVTYRRGIDPALTIAWQASDEDAELEIGLDPDTDHDSGNEIIILERTLSSTSPTSGDDGTRTDGESDKTGTRSRDDESRENGVPTQTPTEGGSETETGGGTGNEGTTTGSTSSFAWEGKDKDGENVAGGTYNLFARVSDNVNPALTVDGPGQITVTEKDSGSGGEPEVIEPAEDTTFLTSDEKLTIEYKTNLDDDALVDIKIDTDDNHKNGNEITILSQHFVEGGEDPDPFEWDGKNAAGQNVDPGIYRVFALVSTGEGTPKTAEAEGLVFRRQTNKQPLVALLAPATAITVDPGDYVMIRWRDDDPDGEATIRLVVDTDPRPMSATEKRLEILAEREAEPDGVQDTFNWQVPSTLSPGTYYVIAFIDDDGSGNASTAPGRVIVRDPENP